MSRLHAGIHFSSGNEVGLKGQKVDRNMSALCFRR